MNLLDLLILAIIGLAVVVGVYRGFSRAALGVIAFVLAILLAFVFRPMLASSVVHNTNMISQIQYFTEGTELVKNPELAQTDVKHLSKQEVDQVLLRSGLNSAIQNPLRDNITSDAFSNSKVVSLSDTINMTLANLVVNVGCYLVLFLIFIILLTFVVGTVDSVKVLPSLQYFNGLMGGIAGFFMGLIFLMVLLTALPVLTAVVPVKALPKLVADSKLVSAVQSINILLGGVLRGVAY